jgi:hypothetical protein
MDGFSRTIDDVLVIGAIAFVAMFVAAVMASAGIYGLIKYRERWEASDTSEQKQELSNAIQGRVIEFCVPDKSGVNRQGDAPVRSQLPARQREQRG